MTSFKDFGLSPEIEKSLADLNFGNPTPVQEQAIPVILGSKKDVVVLSQTGTGKTAAFSLPIISQINPASRDLQAIILCPIRELALQIASDIKDFSKYSRTIKTAVVYGGGRVDIQIRDLRGGAQIVVGTPGRVLDLIRRKLLRLNSIRWLVLDEADEMLNMGFKEDLNAILKETPEDKQSLLFSATMPESVRTIASRYMKNPEEISLGKRNSGAENVSHDFYVVQAQDRYEALRRVLDSLPHVYGILFCRTKRETQEIASKLVSDKYSAEAIHGDVNQNSRTEIMNRFKNKQFRILVATDVAARGIDVKDLTHIINFNLPDEIETYIHRSGRTGRAAKSGVCISIVNTRDMRKVGMIEQRIGKVFQQKKVPLVKDICENQIANIIRKIKDAEIKEDEIKDYLPIIKEQIKEMDREELVKRLICFELDYFLTHYKNASDINANSGKARPSFNRGKEGVNFSRYKINFGKRDKFGLKDLFGFFNRQRELRGIEIGNISLFDNHAIFEADKKRGQEIIFGLKKATFHGRPILVEEIINRENSEIRRFEKRRPDSTYKPKRKFRSRPQR